MAKAGEGNTYLGGGNPYLTPLFSYFFVEAKYNDLFGGGEWEVKEI